MNKIKLTITITLMLTLVSCNNWLELYPENSQTSDQYWQTKEDVEAVVAAGYVKLQNSIDYLFVWGEIRGNGVDIKSTIADDYIEDAQDLRDMNILPSNLYAEWGCMYQVINMANSVIKYAEYVLDRDPSFTESEMNSYLSEAYFQRALAYFYLVRTFRDVPLVLYPYVNDEQTYEIAKSTDDVILEHIVGDLVDALPSAKSYYEEEDYDNPVNSKGRATKWAIYALLADIELWRENYDNCITYCDAIINSGYVGLISSSQWYTNFYPGNSNESIFEIQFDYDYDQANEIYDWFYTDNKYDISSYSDLLFSATESLGDIRGDGASYISTSGRIWKYLGTQIDKTAGYLRESGTEEDNNYIIYRLADVYLMKAEAYVMKNDFTSASELITKIRERAGIQGTFEAEATQLGMLQQVFEERCREFLAEGKNWFDLLRIGKRNNYEYKDFMITQVVKVAGASKISIITSKLADEDSHYLPISQDELDANSMLVQNPYYSSLSN